MPEPCQKTIKSCPWEGNPIGAAKAEASATEAVKARMQFTREMMSHFNHTTYVSGYKIPRKLRRKQCQS